MAETQKRLAHLVSGFGILNEEQAELFSVNLLQNLSIGVENETWSEKRYPAEFAEARRLLTENKAWYLMRQSFMHSVRSIRKLYPRTHWWWWIEEL
jgi:hypothetical protein